ncbi:FAD-dependent oxidoreductase [Specibacter cremeus]|uniref:FAD-dependent oxidoreductase n=1 Tax=Specibacter cremeus TaxID=1629051 RepID=UPI000F796958|nr:FAD-dependent oxidoreductase [Specibacter cremeus]
MDSVVSIAIVGSGPAGCYVAQSLRRALPESEITIYDRLASPFGLVRYGVAPDHQSTKSIQAQFARLFERENVRFAGNITVGSDVSLDELRSTHNIVVLASGLSEDRVVGVPGEDLPEVHRAGRLTRVFNAHPMEPVGVPDFGGAVAVIGGGNVSIDVLRLLIKRPEDFANSDVDDTALGQYAQAPVRRVEFICRSTVANAPSDPVMLAELGRIPGVAFTCSDPVAVPEDATRQASARAKALEGLLELAPGPQTRVQVALHFGWSPVRILGADHVEGVELRSVEDDREHRRVATDSVVTAVGFDFDRHNWHGLGELSRNLETGALDRGLYRTGWIKRGSRGTIAENRACAKAVAEEILADLPALDPAPRPGYDGLPEDVRARAVDYAAWRRVDLAEASAAAHGRARKKFPSHDHMVAIAHDTLAGPSGAGNH